jgi:hypothetical protein
MSHAVFGGDTITSCNRYLSLPPQPGGTVTCVRCIARTLIPVKGEDILRGD